MQIINGVHGKSWWVGSKAGLIIIILGQWSSQSFRFNDGEDRGWIQKEEVHPFRLLLLYHIEYSSDQYKSHH